MRIDEQRRIERERERRLQKSRMAQKKDPNQRQTPGVQAPRKTQKYPDPDRNFQGISGSSGQQTVLTQPQAQIAKDTFPIEKLFLLLCLVFGCLFVFLTPPMQAPDEITHFLKSYSLSQMQLIPKVDENGTVVDEISSEVIDFSNSFGDLQYDANAKIDYSSVNSWGDVYTSDTEGDTQQTTYITVNAYIIYYIPQALGMAFAKLMGMSLLWTLYMGRLFNLIFYCIMLYVAIKTTPLAKNLFFLIALTPMAVFQAASLSYDVMVIAVCVLFTAHMFKLFYDPEAELTSGEFATILILSCILIFMKTVYFPLVLLFLAIPKTKFANIKERRHYFFAIVGTSLVVYIIVFIYRKVVYAGAVSGNSLSTEQIIGALSDPNFFFEMISNTFKAFGSNFSEEFIGKLGWLDTALPPWLITCYYGMLIAALFEFSDYEKSLVNQIDGESLVSMLVLSGIALFAFIVLMFAVFYFIMTLVTLQAEGSSVAQGIQGRYFIPVSFLAFSMVAVVIHYRTNLSSQIYEMMKKINVGFVAVAQVVSLITMCLRYYVS
ncbi:MAG: DUF2142 domain-containing protein [Eubacteriaceae bacterium]|nr:DUF2142 domain-containing protein [Eubacteriaceae bacterium]MDD4508598.1 DUF2142 domain-containing protein [Eubacteriaceae bacterium]